MKGLKALLESAIGQDVPMELCEAIASGIPIIIDGDRNKATGKSYLCDALRRHGINAHEMWEFEEGSLKLQPDTNKVAVCVWLGQDVSLNL